MSPVMASYIYSFKKAELGNIGGVIKVLIYGGKFVNKLGGRVPRWPTNQKTTPLYGSAVV